jgi:hypothetical protein
MGVKMTNMLERVASNLATVIADEIHSDCPEESMNRFLNDIDGQITDCAFTNGLIVLNIKKNGVLFNLELKPVSWHKV